MAMLAELAVGAVGMAGAGVGDGAEMVVVVVAEMVVAEEGVDFRPCQGKKGDGVVWWGV